MFDMKTAQMLTAAIFGLSTLISSYLVYNVEKRIQVPERPSPPPLLFVLALWAFSLITHHPHLFH